MLYAKHGDLPRKTEKIVESGEALKQERRSGKERREKDLGSPDEVERRKNAEARNVEAVEVELSDVEWKMHFGNQQTE